MTSKYNLMSYFI